MGWRWEWDRAKAARRPLSDTGPAECARLGGLFEIAGTLATYLELELLASEGLATPRFDARLQTGRRPEAASVAFVALAGAEIAAHLRQSGPDRLWRPQQARRTSTNRAHSTGPIAMGPVTIGIDSN